MSASVATHLFVGHELDGRFGGDLEHVDAVPPPQRGDPSLLHHPPQSGPQIDGPGRGAVHLEPGPLLRYSRVASDCEVEEPHANPRSFADGL